MAQSMTIADEELLLQLERCNATLAAVGDFHGAMIRVTEEQALYERACQALTARGAYPLAWIGVPDPGHPTDIDVRALAGAACDYLVSTSRLDGADESSVARALRTGGVQYGERLQTSVEGLPWRSRAIASGLHSSVSLPLCDAGGVPFAVLSVYTSAPGAFADTEVDLLRRLVEDLAYAVQTLRTRAAYETALATTRRYTAHIQGLLEESVQALGAALEKRDPYTAGHQQRVAALSVAIAEELGWDADRTQGLRLAALVHDLGKIQVPTEILVKPSKLNPFEWQMLQEHPTVGFEILRPIDYPWPVAEAVRQHHERLDGSGYPQGLCGEAISAEARIIGVADIVESVSSDRPYRAALGLEYALAEIQRLAPDKLDAGVVAACERVIRERGFRFEA